MTKRHTPTTSISYHTNDAIFVRGVNLVDDLIGKVGFVEMMLLNILGRMPTTEEAGVVEAVMVTLMEHGFTPSAIAARLIYSSSPEALQGAVAAGILAAGSQMLGTLENAAELLEELVSDKDDVEVAARRIVTDYIDHKKRLPGFGHADHRPDDPRPARHFELAEELKLPGHHMAALKSLSQAVDELYGKHITINASASMAALLCEVGLPKEIFRGLAVVTRAAGLVAHIFEEMSVPTMIPMMKACEEAIPYESKGQ